MPRLPTATSKTASFIAVDIVKGGCAEVLDLTAEPEFGGRAVSGARHSIRHMVGKAAWTATADQPGFRG